MLNIINETGNQQVFKNIFKSFISKHVTVIGTNQIINKTETTNLDPGMINDLDIQCPKPE